MEAEDNIQEYPVLLLFPLYSCLSCTVENLCGCSPLS